MSAIGDYIHLTYEGYMGIRKTADPYFYQAGKVIKQHRGDFYKDVDKMTSSLIPKLQKEINAQLDIMNAFQEKYQGSKEYPEENIVIQRLLENIAEKLGDKWFRQDILQAIANGFLSGEAMTISKALTSQKNTALTDIQAQTVKHANEKLGIMLQKVLGNVAALLRKNQVSEQEIQSHIGASQQNINNFLQWLSQQNSTVAEKDSVIENEIRKIFENLKNIMLDENTTSKTLVQPLIEELIHSISVYKKYTDWKGEGGEVLTYAIVKGALASAFKSVADVDVVGTTGRSLSGIDTTKFSKIFEDQYSILLRGKGDDAKFSYGDFIASTELTKANKMDVVLQMKNGSKLGISVKNYSDATMIKKGIENSVANLLTLLQNENKDDFINHYLNLSSIKKDGDYVFRNDLNREAAYKLIRQIIAAKLLTGYNTTAGLNETVQNTAKLLIRYNDKGTNLANGRKGASVEIYAMKDILKKGLFSRNRYNIRGFPEFLINEAETTPEIRIHKIISQLAIPVSHTVTLSDLQNS